MVHARSGDRVRYEAHLGGPTVGAQLIGALRRYPDRVAFSWDGGALTYAGALDLVGRMQRVFADRGLRRQATVAILTANRADAWCAGLAAHASAMRLTWLHPIGSLDDHLEQLEDSEAEALVVDTASFGERGGELAARALGVRTVFTLGAAAYGTDLSSAAATVGSARACDLADATDVATLNYTGGTTGRSKGVLRRHAQAVAMTNGISASFEFSATPRFLAVAPISHAAGAKVGPVLLRGGTIHMLPKFDPDRVLATIERERIDTALFVPTMVYVLLDHPALDRTDLSSLALLLYGASPMSPTRLVEGLERIGPVFSQFYGQTECHPIAVLHRADHDAAQPDLFAAAGMPVSSCGVRLFAEDGHEAKDGDAGEIGVRAPQAMESYWKRPEQTAETIRDGWLMTGDIARTDERGYLYLVDRKKDMIVSGGFNVYPRTVEDALSAHADVAMAAVFGVPDEKWGEAVMALVVARPGTRPDAQALIAHVKALRGSTCAPKVVEFAESLPLTALGKVDKKALRAKHWAGRDRGIG
ncbi:MAG: AMP-binding protein [Candidatus Eremiobacteraeota bacterium]|nr:AMP-binding protein [Candidatus Eremiobacteraeota bacterium]